MPSPNAEYKSIVRVASALGFFIYIDDLGAPAGWSAMSAEEQASFDEEIKAGLHPGSTPRDLTGNNSLFRYPDSPELMDAGSHVILEYAGTRFSAEVSWGPEICGDDGIGPDEIHVNLTLKFTRTSIQRTNGSSRSPAASRVTA